MPKAYGSRICSILHNPFFWWSLCGFLPLEVENILKYIFDTRRIKGFCTGLKPNWNWSQSVHCPLLGALRTSRFGGGRNLRCARFLRILRVLLKWLRILYLGQLSEWKYDEENCSEKPNWLYFSDPKYSIQCVPNFIPSKRLLQTKRDPAYSSAK